MAADGILITLRGIFQRMHRLNAAITNPVASRNAAPPQAGKALALGLGMVMIGVIFGRRTPGARQVIL